ncbi:KRI1-like family-domain-containing protein [Phakopsora pachyrhizi]|uniref:KRI1-like family-domain-containing protein n=1 Tax=Phakopsora pachyrhizi TaxID=170000 RepID=A0AAV0BN58_PHAPC|nr:KRI1-like family-domain-containing protein [Phakopsora pachyrhizi]CAH7688086.1 KRI1-like family-domain-containing protein [Phakopsora pachyrhizi]
MAPVDLFDELNGNKEKSRKASESSDSDHSENEFNYDEDYARKYERQKRSQELMRLKDKYGEDYEPSDSDESLSSEDSDAELVTPEVDAAIFKTLARIKMADPKLYSGQDEVFQDEEARHLSARGRKIDGSSQSHKKKPMHLRDYQRKALLTDETSVLGISHESPDTYQKTPAEEAESLREETKRAFHSFDASENSDDSEGELDLLIPREKASDEREQEELEYQKFLIDQVGSEDIKMACQITFEKDALQEHDDSDLKAIQDENEEFLRNYLLGRGWIDKEDKRIPKYAEITKSNNGERKSVHLSPSNPNAVILGQTVVDKAQGDDEDEEFVERAEEFEASYNFRFENSVPSISTHSRSIETSARRKDDSRKQARDSLKARKAEEKQIRLDELKRMKELKKKEVVEKLEVISKNAGAGELNLEELDLDSDFDPDKHDMRMSKVFDRRFYTQSDPDGKPVWDEDIEIDDIIPPTENLVDGDFNFEPGGDAYDPTAGSSKRKSRLPKKQNKRAKVNEPLNHQSEEDAATLDLEGLTPEERKKKLLQALDEYHRMDYEDIIGDLPTRFKYAKVEANDIMTPSEIFLATDAELNEVIGLKKLAPYRNKPDAKAANRKKKLKQLREKLKGREWGNSITTKENQPKSKVDIATAGSSARPSKKRRGKKERLKLKDAQEHAAFEIQ